MSPVSDKAPEGARKKTGSRRLGGFPSREGRQAYQRAASLSSLNEVGYSAAYAASSFGTS